MRNHYTDDPKCNSFLILAKIYDAFIASFSGLTSILRLPKSSKILGVPKSAPPEPKGTILMSAYDVLKYGLFSLLLFLLQDIKKHWATKNSSQP
jgi:hypothetical protein